MVLVAMSVRAQIKIGGNVYGGGNEGYVEGNTTVTVCAGDIGAREDNSSEASGNSDEAPSIRAGKVFGGARMANVGGNTYVHIDGAHASDDMVINQVFGGNDISGVVGTNPDATKRLPEELENNAKGVDDTWNSFVHVSTKTTTTGEGENAVVSETSDAKKIFIGQLFGGGNGDYDYEGEEDDESTGTVTHKIFNLPRTNNDKPIAMKVTTAGEAGFTRPELAKSFIDIHGGTIADSYGGGNNATVTEKAVICVNNPSVVTTNADLKTILGMSDDTEVSQRIKEMGIARLSKTESDEFQIGCLFGGNNKADMDIRPTWHLQDGRIRYLYSGGNRGRMTHEQGIFLEIPEESKVVVDNLFGGCRMADVRPLSKTTGRDVERVIGKLDDVDYAFPDNLAARVMIAGGDVNNVYGGNDVRGRVYFGSAVGIQTSVRGDVYGGGNGAYAYTYSRNYEEDEVYGDYYYDIENQSLGIMDALSVIRPNAEQVSIQVRGKDAKHPTIIKGSIYVGGNCATLKAAPNHMGLDMGPSKKYPLTELKIGSHAIVENVFLGNNGEKMVDEDILKLYSDKKFNPDVNFRDQSSFSDYMKGVSLSQIPSLVVEDQNKGDRFSYVRYTSYIGSLYYGSNRGSMTYSGPIDINPDAPIYIYNKLVAGCNNANIAATEYNAPYEGGILGDEAEQQEGGYLQDGKIKDRVLLNPSKIKLKPMRLNSDKTDLEWNTVIKGDYEAVADGTTLTVGKPYYTSAEGAGKFVADGTEVANGSNYYEKTNGWVKTPAGSGTGEASKDDLARRLLGGNIYGGCCESGHVNGNVVINLDGTLVDRQDIFDAFEGEEDGDDILYERDSYIITKRNSGVILNEQGMDVLGSALNVYGGGMGAGTEIWGSTTVNLLKGYTFQIFGGSENGVIGKSMEASGQDVVETDATAQTTQNYDYEFNGKHYQYNPAYSTNVNLNGSVQGEKRSPNSPVTMAEAEFIYGGSFSGPIIGDVNVHLDNGRLFNLFAGSCNADILGHVETYVGLNGFPYLRDHIYGGNDLGGEIKGVKNFTDRVSDNAVLQMVHDKDADVDGAKDVLQANAYIEYRQGRMKNIFGGCFGDYDYDKEFPSTEGYSIPKLDNAFVNFRPVENSKNRVSKIFGAGEGYAGERYGDKMQNRSYVLVDIADNKDYYADLEVFGSGQNNGLGMDFSAATTFAGGFNSDKASAIIDLVRGQVFAAYGGSFNEGVTRRTLVNVPKGSTIKIGSIFGGAYGSDTYTPCDVYEANVNYHSGDAYLIYDPDKKDEDGNLLWKGAIYGGNNRERRTLYSKINIDVPVRQKHPVYNMTTATVYGAGFGSLTWNEYTEVNLNPGASVWEVYGGGQAGGVMSAESVQAYIALNPKNINDEEWKVAWSLGGSGYDATTFTGTQGYAANIYTNLTNSLVRPAEIDDRAHVTSDSPNYKKYNTNVIIHEGAYVGNYAYGGGLGKEGDAFYGSGDVYGSTYIALLGGTVNKDIYAAGTSGSVYDLFNAKSTFSDFKATSNAYILGGSVRNVYGGGWQGGVGSHKGDITADTTDDIPGDTHVVIGDVNGNSFTNGIPAILRNAYGGGEGGAVYGSTYLTLNNGYVGYEYKDGAYQEKEEDDTKETPNKLLKDAGCLFGGGYVDNSSVDKTNVKIYGGHVRNSAFGGGEIAAVGRGTVNKTTSGDQTKYTLTGLFRPGKTKLEMFGGHVHRNVFGGGRGYDNLNRHGSLNSDGFVFGQTEVHIHGGEIGTMAGVANNDGNVFGGGDVGFVYSAYENPDGTFGRGKKIGERYKDDHQGYYFKHEWAEDGSFITETVGTTTENIFTEDCKVLIEPQAKVLADVTVNGKYYTPGQYVPIDDLNTLKSKAADGAKWNCLDPTGIIIHNAVFAGGNTSPGAAANANATSVFGNATASIHDVYNRDLITLGTRHTGGLYGDGNLTFVDGYRELNITNYGTDYYSIQDEIDIDTYHNLPDREAAYYELKYKCVLDCEDKDGTHYRAATDESGKASTISADDYFTVFKDWKYNGEDMIVADPEDPNKLIPNPKYWSENGVLPVYAGRLMNSIQRADFCGVWGSRMVMQGAQDRVPEEVDYTNYTINRVREVSLNKVTSPAQDTDDKNKEHGNYFGIYNIVNYLGALTSDVKFDDVRLTDNTDTGTYQCEANGKAYKTATYYDWKSAFHDVRKRNNGSSHNKVALASGVYLELTSEESTGNTLEEKVWGPVTGIVELDLINVQPGIGGGFVYAQNVHGKPSKTYRKNTTLTALNKGAVTQWDYTYLTADDTDSKVEWQTSGNFVHSSQTIIDDCYNISGKYMSQYKAPDGVPAHYWFIKGEVYVYDQYISAYTGIPNAYSETVEIPLTITAASHGTMKLLNVQPNYYAYYASSGVKLADEQKLVINDKTYYKNDPISFWDWYMLSNSEKELFVSKTYVNCMTCKIDGTEYEAGTYVMTDSEFENFKRITHTYRDAEGQVILDGDKNEADADYIFRESNNMSHDTGYILTYKVNNPGVWDTWYTKFDQNTKNQTGGDGYNNGPTYRLSSGTGSVLGQREYKVGNIISKNIEDTYQAITNKPAFSTQATFDEAYIVTDQVTITEDGNTRHLNPGSTVSKADATTDPVYSGKTSPAYICTSTIQLSKTEFIYVDTKMTETERNAYYDRFKNGTDAEKKIAAEILANIVPAYYCTKDGLYGGNYYEGGKNYRGLEAWSSMSETDRKKFAFNYDALDLLIDPSYSNLSTALVANKYQYDSSTATKEAAGNNPAGYSLTSPLDYTATYFGDADLQYTTDGGTSATATKANRTELSRTEYERLPNEQRHYAVINVKNGNKVGDKYKVYVVNQPFQIGNTPYAIGSVVDAQTYNGLTDKSNVTELTFTDPGNAEEGQTYYYCRECYKVGYNGDGVDVTNQDGLGAEGFDENGQSVAIKSGAAYTTGEQVPIGVVIPVSTYSLLASNNKQQNFTIHGISPTEVSTLYVSRQSDIYDLSKEKIITVVYQYDYDEVQTSGAVTPVSERHVVNIHINFKSGMPIVDDIVKPNIILPGDYITMKEPDTTPGAYEITGGGWELFEDIHDAESHSNGIDYNPMSDPLYWYQNEWYLAYYAKTYLGRSYSNHVPVSVANYHDLKKVMEAKEHHYYVDEPKVKRDPKIYINDYRIVDEQGHETAESANGLDLLKNLFDLSVLNNPDVDQETGLIESGTFQGHKPLKNQVSAGNNLDFILRTDLDHSGSSWTSIGSGDDPCFSGTLHGDGYAISGLDHSLFGKLCGNVYNLGVTGSFTTAGVADTGEGYVENCWVNTTGVPDGTVYAVFGNPSDKETTRKQIVNSYYQEGKNYKAEASDHGVAIAKPAKAFNNGEVAYDLNGFYLYKRYNDNASPSPSPVTTTYHYWKSGETEPQDGSYAENKAFCSSGYNQIKYVEDRFEDGDFMYAGGTIPDNEDERYYLETVTNSQTGSVTQTEHYYPIWPDDYLFFGQTLTYGYVNGRQHQSTPSSISRRDGHVPADENSNRVYRAPAYFRNSTMGVAHFNPYAVFAQTAHRDMTAIDFTGSNGDLTGGYTLGLQGSKFYPPLLDDGGLSKFLNVDLTKNLLVYTGGSGENTTALEKTATVVGNYLLEPAYVESNPIYRTVDQQSSEYIYGHWIENGVASRDHFLVDKEDFNAPIKYRYASDKRMWYQRQPAEDEYVDLKKGWSAISLPFTADIVTTHQKGEITHFYGSSSTGHEYWLREFKGNIKAKEGESGVITADFSRPAATGNSTDDKTVKNTFLWDYYYKGVSHEQKDYNNDTYQVYYRDSREYKGYPLLSGGKPYLFGLPGKTYYEFDLSGQFEATTTAASNPKKLDSQTITFASVPGAEIQVSDGEMAGVTSNGYAFRPNYLNLELPAAGQSYTLKANNGNNASSFDKVPATGDATPVYAFRPYFTSSSAGTRSIIFDYEEPQPKGEAEHGDPTAEELNGGLRIWTKKDKIYVESSLKFTADMRVVTPAGITVATFSVKPGKTVEVKADFSGMYIVHTLDGKYTKKVTVKRE